MNYDVGIEIIYDTEVLKSNLCDYNDAEDLDLAMPMYNFIEYSPNYSQTTGSLWFYSKDEATDFNNSIPNTDDFKSFKYKETQKRSPIQIMLREF